MPVQPDPEITSQYLAGQSMATVAGALRPRRSVDYVRSRLVADGIQVRKPGLRPRMCRGGVADRPSMRRR